MKSVQIPTFFHEVFGKRQLLLHLISVLVVGFVLTISLFLYSYDSYELIPFWKMGLAFILIFDIFAGVLANLTSGTNDYYMQSHLRRMVFIAIHVHILLIAYLLGANFFIACLVWLYTICSAYIVNLLKDEPQVFTAGVLFLVGLLGVSMLWITEPLMLIVAIVFLFKVIFSFGVNHYKEKEREE
ncbi:hypothetical protein ACERJO_08335 [Halalkalibacter sp. AB-rgal2]|uniref:hypothetical protein n=1 Tax=Halalkalibacter sp. AB-rgal2 TaxID=3242695 RepID=UPI00359CD8A9